MAIDRTPKKPINPMWTSEGIKEWWPIVRWPVWVICIILTAYMLRCAFVLGASAYRALASPDTVSTPKKVATNSPVIHRVPPATMPQETPNAKPQEPATVSPVGKSQEQETGNRMRDFNLFHRFDVNRLDPNSIHIPPVLNCPAADQCAKILTPVASDDVSTRLDTNDHKFVTPQKELGEMKINARCGAVDQQCGQYEQPAWQDDSDRYDPNKVAVSSDGELAITWTHCKRETKFLVCYGYAQNTGDYDSIIFVWNGAQIKDEFGYSAPIEFATMTFMGVGRQTEIGRGSKAKFMFKCLDNSKGRAKLILPSISFEWKRRDITVYGDHMVPIN